jgi:hypothetical protein
MLFKEAAMQRGNVRNSYQRTILLLIFVIPVLLLTASCVKQQTIGVIFAVHGGFDT